MFLSKFIYKYQKQVFQNPRRGSKEAADLNLRKQTAKKMQEKLVAQTTNIENNTPRIVSGLMALMTIPSFYFFYQVLDLNYEDVGCFAAIRKSVDWIGMKSALNCGMLISLQFMKYTDFKAKNKLVSRTPFKYVFYTAPILLSLASLSCMESLSPWLMLPTVGNVVGTLVAFSHATNFGTAPFWCFAITYQIFFLDLILVFSLAYALNNLNKHRAKRPDLYAQY